MHVPAPAPRELDDTPIVFDARPPSIRMPGSSVPPPSVMTLDDLAALMAGLTFGEIVELAEALHVDAPRIHRWATGRTGKAARAQ